MLQKDKTILLINYNLTTYFKINYKQERLKFHILAYCI
jgi:hypothetical protein